MTSFENACKKLDEIRGKFDEQRRYNRNTTLLVIYLWGIGLPLTFFGCLIYAATRS